MIGEAKREKEQRSSVYLLELPANGNVNIPDSTCYTLQIHG